MKRRKFTLYIRRHREGDRSESIEAAIRIAWFKHWKVPFYVLAQHGVRKVVMGAGGTRKEILGLLIGPKQIAPARGGDWERPTARDFRIWAARVGRRARTKQNLTARPGDQ